MTGQLEKLLNGLCVELGFCLSPDQSARIVRLPLTSAKEFTDAVFVAEGLDPNLADRHLWRQVNTRVIQYFKELEAGSNA